jgi:hypothetical protein
MQRLLILLTFLLIGITTAFAHNPRLEVDDWGNFDAPYIVEDATVSFAFFGYLEDDLDVFRLDFEDDDTLRLELLIPVCGDSYQDFYPQIFVLGAGDEPLESLDELLSEVETTAHDLPIITPTASPTAAAASQPTSRVGEFPEGLSLLYTYDTRPEDMTDERPSFFEHHTGRDYYEVSTDDIEVTAGSYYLVLFDPVRVGGDYLLATGYVEAFFMPLASEPESVSIDWRDEWPNKEC